MIRIEQKQTAKRKKMKTQKNLFMNSEGDNCFKRNKSFYQSLNEKEDIIINLFKYLNFSLQKILEVGCSNGRVLNYFNKIFDSECWEIDPSKKAIKDGKQHFPKINLGIGTADSLPFEIIVLMLFFLVFASIFAIEKISLKLHMKLTDARKIKAY